MTVFGLPTRKSMLQPRWGSASWLSFVPMQIMPFAVYGQSIGAPTVYGRLSEFQLSTDRLLSNLPSTDGLLIRLSTSSSNMGLAPYQCILFLPSIDGLSLNLPFMNGLSLYLPYLNGLILCLPCVNGPMYSQPCFDGLDQCSVSQASVLDWTLLSSFASGRYGTSHLVVNIISLVPASVQLYICSRSHDKVVLPSLLHVVS